VRSINDGLGLVFLKKLVIDGDMVFLGKINDDGVGVVLWEKLVVDWGMVGFL